MTTLLGKGFLAYRLIEELMGEMKESTTARGGQVHVKTVSYVCHKMAVFGKKI